MGLHSTSIFSLDANVAGECWKLGLSMHFLNKFHHAAPARINRVMERPSKRACERAPRSPSIFYSIPLRECVPLVFEPLSLSPSPFAFERKRLRRTRRRRLEARFRSASPRALPLPPLSLFLASSASPRSLACSLPFPIQSSEAFPDRVTLRRFFRLSHISANISRLSFSVLPTFLEFRKPVSSRNQKVNNRIKSKI